MQSIELVRDNLERSRDRVLARCREVRESTIALVGSLTEEDLDRESANPPEGFRDTFGTHRLCLQFVADHWYMHRGRLADARRAAGLERTWLSNRRRPGAASGSTWR